MHCWVAYLVHTGRFIDPSLSAMFAMLHCRSLVSSFSYEFRKSDSCRARGNALASVQPPLILFSPSAMSTMPPPSSHHSATPPLAQAAGAMSAGVVGQRRQTGPSLDHPWADRAKPLVSLCSTHLRPQARPLSSGHGVNVAGLTHVVVVLRSSWSVEGFVQVGH